MSGLGPTGFDIKDLDTILSEIESDQQAAFGTDWDVSPSTPQGILNGIVAAKISDLYQQVAAVYASQFPNGATDTSLDQLCQLTGTRRLAATQSAITASITGTPGTVLFDGFDNTRIKNNGTNTLWYLAMGTAAGSQVTIPAASSCTAAFQSADFGAIQGDAGTLNIIDTPISGWTAVTNPSDATVGRALETDAALRIRRTQLLAAAGVSTVDAIQSAVAKVSNVTSVTVLENVTDTTDANSTPDHAFQTVVLGGADNDIAQAIWNSKPAGISAYGTSSASATDSRGNARIVGFSRPAQLTVYASITAVTGTGWSGATADIANALTTYGAALGVGAAGSPYPGFIAYRDLYTAIFGVSGVRDVTGLGIDYSSLAATGTSNLAVGVLQIATWDTSRIQVTLQ